MSIFKGRVKRKHFFRVFVVLGSILIALLIAESVLRATLYHKRYIWPPKLKMVFEPQSDVMPGVSGRSEFEINSIGFRGDELASTNTYRILAIGGSTTICLYLDQAETWPILLQKTLNKESAGHDVWIGNAGLSA